MSIAIDASTPAIFADSGGLPIAEITSNAFTPPAGSLIIVFFGNGASGAAGQDGTSCTASAGALTFTQMETGALNSSVGAASVWIAQCVTSPGSITVTIAIPGPAATNGHFILPVVITGAVKDDPASWSGAVATMVNTSTQFAVPITPNETGSMVLAVLATGTTMATPTLLANTTDVLNGITQFATNADTTSRTLVGQATTLTTAATLVTVGCADTATALAGVAIEIPSPGITVPIWAVAADHPSVFTSAFDRE